MPPCRCYNCAKARDDQKRAERLKAAIYGTAVPPIPKYETRHVIACTDCGYKRCPHGTDHKNPCTTSNEPGQKGSRYP